jgi:hypothetical protein
MTRMIVAEFFLHRSTSRRGNAKDLIWIIELFDPLESGCNGRSGHPAFDQRS